jgi:hypothetical protein
MQTVAISLSIVSLVIIEMSRCLDIKLKSFPSAIEAAFIKKYLIKRQSYGSGINIQLQSKTPVTVIITVHMHSRFSIGKPMVKPAI